ncbi:hypothetical protein ACL02P_15180 [Paenibacillus sp. MB22_1]|uniref:hypothetical protein n=1 Tax=Paenibacillus sp. MB22_1 TaxID=3383121 RepID=UPI0039A071A5
MKATIDCIKETFLESNYNNINDWWKVVTDQIYQMDRLIYCVKIDDQELFSGYEEYISKYYDRIREVHIETKSKLDSYLETKLVVREYLEKLVPACHELADQFYGGVNEEGWKLFSQFIEGLDWLIHAFEFMQVLNRDLNLNPIIKELQVIISELSSGVQNQDLVLVGDLIQYEIVTALEKFLELDI